MPMLSADGSFPTENGISRNRCKGLRRRMQSVLIMYKGLTGAACELRHKTDAIFAPLEAPRD